VGTDSVPKEINSGFCSSGRGQAATGER